MKTSSKYIQRPVSLFVAAILMSCIMQAQDRDKYDSIAAKYKNENAVYTNVKEQLVITVEDGELQANSYVTMEKLFISDLSLSTYNSDYFVYSDFNGLTGCSGNAYIPSVGKTYKKVACNAFGTGRPHDYVFYDDFRMGQAYYSGLKKNSITETKYSTEDDVHMLSSFEFQDIFEKLPIASATFEVVAPNFVNMSFAIKGENTQWIKQTKEEKNGKVYYRFTASDIPAPKGFENVPSWRYYVPHVIPYITSYRLVGAKKDSVLANSPDDLYRYLYNYVRGLNMKQDTFLAKIVAQVTKDDVSARDKAAHIYKWVQDNIHYVAIEYGLEGFIPRPADTVFKRKYGDCKDMASIIVSMCRKAGLNAYYTWIGTDQLPYTQNELPLSINFNHMICALKLGDEWVFIDGTHPLLPFGYNRDDIQGKEVLIAIDEHNYKIMNIPVEPADKNVTADSTFISIDGRKIVGSLEQLYKGYGAWDLGYKMMYYKKEDDKEKMVKALTERGSNKYLQKKYDIKTGKKGNRDVTINADFVVADYVQHVGKECYVNMNLLRQYEDNHIDTKDRSVANYFDYKTKRREVVELEIPKGYHVKYLPPSAKGAVGDLWSYSISYKADKKKVTLIKEYELDTLSIVSDKFTDNNKTVDELKKLYKESVVLTAN